tara:strand:- start:209 stop:1408 length:1200 start_codon:yes stop_codon:yes gene_type:complete
MEKQIAKYSLPISKLEGMFISDTNHLNLKNKLTNNIQETFSKSQYISIDCPILEPTELYERKSGGEISKRLYSFSEPNGRKVSLRPEFTSSIIRILIEANASNSSEYRYQYSGPVFRNQEKNLPSSTKQFTQLGAELIGNNSIQSDAEILSLSLEGISKTHIKHLTVAIGNVGPIREFLGNSGFTEALTDFTLDNINNLQVADSTKSLTQKALNLGLLSNGISDTDSSAEATIQELLIDIESKNNSYNFGRRTVDEVAERLRKKQSNSLKSSQYNETLTVLLNFFREFSKTNVVSIQSASYPQELLNSISYISNVVKEVSIPKNIDVTFLIDFERNRGLTYYTGIIFDLETEINQKTKTIGGGGRYDGLFRALGHHTDIPAIGFAVNIDEIISLDRGET